MLQLRHTGAEIVPQGPVTRAADFAALLDAQAVLARAQEEAARIRAEAEREYHEQKERGYRDGLEQGKAEISERVVSTAGQSALYVSKLEDSLVDLVIKSTRRVIGEFDAHDRVERTVRQALALLRTQSQVRIKVSPAQRERLQARIEALLATFPALEFLEVHADARLPEDGCVLETELGVIDATVETQLRAIEKALIQSIK